MKRLAIGAPRTTLIVAPHSDDETIGAFGLIRALKLSGRRVKVLVVTDGAGSHRDSLRWPSARLIAERRRETRRAMRSLGIGAGDVRYLGLPDGGLDLDTHGQMATIAHAVRQIAQLDLIVAPTANDAHADHRAVAAAVARTRVPGVRRLSYLVWPERSARKLPSRKRLPLCGAVAAKRGTIRRYRTQMGAITDDPAGFAISPGEFRAFSRPVEYFTEERRCGRSR